MEDFQEEPGINKLIITKLKLADLNPLVRLL